MNGLGHDTRRSLRHVSVALDRSGGWPVYAQRSAPFGRFTGVYHVWVWPLCFQVIVGPLSMLKPRCRVNGPGRDTEGECFDADRD